jgi:hypothetical protein
MSGSVESDGTSGLLGRSMQPNHLQQRHRLHILTGRSPSSYLNQNVFSVSGVHGAGEDRGGVVVPVPRPRDHAERGRWAAGAKPLHPARTYPCRIIIICVDHSIQLVRTHVLLRIIVDIEMRSTRPCGVRPVGLPSPTVTSSSYVPMYFSIFHEIGHSIQLVRTHVLLK